MNRFLPILVFGLCCSYAFTAPGIKGYGLLKGRVVDHKDESWIEYATIALYRAGDSSLVTGVISGPDGSFSIPELELGNYYIRVNYLGYEAFRMDSIQLDSKLKDLGNIGLKRAANQLQEVSVRGGRSVMETKIDKKIFHAENSIVSKGGTALDLLRDVPSVEVDENDVIYLRGQSSVIILIDGRPVSMNAAQYLKLLAATSIDQVEIITNPSAKYDAEGMSGILNVITKKNRNSGLTGNLNGSLGYSKDNKFRIGSGLFYRTPKINLSVAYNHANNRYVAQNIIQRSVYLNNTSWDRLRTIEDRFTTQQTHLLKGGLDYFMNDRNTLYGSATYNRGQIDRQNIIQYCALDGNGNILQTATRSGPTGIPSGSLDWNAGWQRSFPSNGATLDLDLNYSESYYEATETLTENAEAENAYFLHQQTDSRDDNSLLLAKWDLSLPLTDSMQLESGIHFTSRTSVSNIYSTVQADGIPAPAIAMDNDFQYVQSVGAAYTSLARQFRKVGLKIGLRSEQTYTTATQLAVNDEFINNYLVFFPTAHISYQWNDMSDLTLSYGKRINRPTIEMLNPFTYYADRMLQEMGNPHLQPEIIHVNEATFHRSGKKLSLTSTWYYRHIRNKNRRYLKQEEDIAVITYKNVANSGFSGVELISMYRFPKILKVNATLNIWNYSIADPFLTGGKMVNNLGVNAGLNFYLRFPKGWNVQVRNFYRPRYEIQQGYMLPLFITAFGCKKSILNGKGNLSLNLTDVFNTNGAQYRSYPEPDYQFTGDWKWETRVIYLGFSANPGKTVKGKQKRATRKDNGTDPNNVPGM